MATSAKSPPILSPDGTGAARNRGDCLPSNRLLASHHPVRDPHLHLMQTGPRIRRNYAQNDDLFARVVGGDIFRVFAPGWGPGLQRYRLEKFATLLLHHPPWSQRV